MLTASPEYVKELMGTFTERQVLGSHYNHRDFERRMKVWKQNNFADDDRDVFKDFLLRWNISYIELDLSFKKLDQFKSLRIFIERNGKFINYQTAEANEEQRRMELELQEKKRKQEEAQRREQRRAQEEAERLQVQQEEVRLKMIKLRQDDRERLEKKSAYLRYARLTQQLLPR